MIGALRIRDGRTYFATEMTCWSEPIAISRLWLVAQVPPAYVTDGATATYHPGSPARLSFHDAGGKPWEVFCDGSAPADFNDERPVPPPRTSLETRWRNGRWERNTKRGWK